MTAEQFSAAYTNGFKSTVRTLCRFGTTLDEAHEIAQKSWARAWECRHQWHGRATITSWVGRIAINYRNDSFRNADVWGNMPAIDPLVSDVVVDPLILKAIEKMDPAASDLVKRVYLDGQCTDEIASRNGFSASTVRVQLWRARAHLRELLSAR